MKLSFARSLTFRLFVGLLVILTISQVSYTFLRAHIVRMEYEAAMLRLASAQFSHQAEALVADPNVNLPANTQRRFQRVDLIWRAEQNVFGGDGPTSQPGTVNGIEAAMSELGVEPVAIFAEFAPSTKFDTVEGAGGKRYRGPIPPMETLVAAQLPGVDGWIIARLRAGPPPPPATFLDIILNLGIVLALGLVGVLALMGTMRRALADLRGALEQVGPQGLGTEVTPRGPSEFHPVFEAMNTMSRQVKELMSEMDVMLGAIGHDLRTPLTSLRLTLESMGPEDEKERAVATIDKAGGILEDILELARADNVDPPTTRYDLAALIEDLVADAEERGEDVTFERTGRVTALCRPDSIRRMVQNLIGNAVKYAGQARIRLREMDGRVEITVADDGPGLPDNMLEAIMKPFERGEKSRNAGIGGSGLGLTLARAVARTHGGDLVLENREPNGLLARVSIPTG